MQGLFDPLPPIRLRFGPADTNDTTHPSTLFEPIATPATADPPLPPLPPLPPGALHSLAHALHTRSSNASLALGLIAKRVHVSVADHTGLQPLHHAAQTNASSAVFAALVRHGADVNARAGASWGNRTPLHFAAHHGHTHAAHELLRLGADSACRDTLGQTPLHVAVAAAHVSLVDALSLDGAAVHVADHNMATPLHHACELAHTLATNTEPCSPALTIVSTLLARGARVEARDCNMDTPLHEAAAYAAYAVAEELLHHNADLTATNSDGHTPLHRLLIEAADRPDALSLASLFVSHGADLFASDHDGLTPLRAAPAAWRPRLLDIVQTQQTFASSRSSSEDVKEVASAPTDQRTTITLSANTTPLAPLRCIIKTESRPTFYEHTESTHLHPPLVALCSPPTELDNIVIAARILDRNHRDCALSSAHAALGGELLSGHVERLRNGRASFERLAIPTALSGGLYFIQLCAYSDYGTPQQYLVGLSDYIPVLSPKHRVSDADRLFQRMWSNSLPQGDTTEWNRLSVSLQNAFTSLVGIQSRGLSLTDMDYLFSRVAVSKANQDAIPKQAASDFCWKWLYQIAMSIRHTPRILDMWNYGAIYGFVNRDLAEDVIRSCGPGVALARFSESDAQAFALGYMGHSDGIVTWAKVGREQLDKDHTLADILVESKIESIVDAQGIVHPADVFLGQFCASPPNMLLHNNPNYVNVLSSSSW
eukprot:TRINITY_DN5218_c0_g1_i1.p1 TRINITY_DN5218_c0_g1~~TRINITY_DN5218_c0_g1_i1.p1  ORF type:complete len:712 (-),score=133.29 TRINITY_DN5218_c0_g1_i1:347-2482(-)